MKPLLNHILLAFLFIVHVTAIAQNAKITAGKEAFQKSDYKVAMDYFNQSLYNVKSLKAEDAAQAYYYRALTSLRLYSDANMKNTPDLLKQHGDGLIKAYADLTEGNKYAHGDVLKKIDAELKNLQFPLIQEGLKSLNEAYDLKSAGKLYENAAKRAEDHLVAAQSIGDSYLACDLTGQFYLLKGDYENSLQYLDKSIGLYQLNPPAEPDFMMGYVYYRIAQVNLVYQHDDKKALDVITIGQEFLESENKRFDKIKSTLSEKKRDQIMKQYDAASLDLQNMKLDIYMNAPDHYNDALKVFEEEIKKNPDDVSLYVVYASLLEKSDKDLAIDIYSRALAIDSTNQIASFNIAALFYNKGENAYDAAMNEPSEGKYEILMESANENFEKSKPFFMKVLAADPASLEAVQALKAIAIIQDDKESYEKYKAMEIKLHK